MTPHSSSARRLSALAEPPPHGAALRAFHAAALDAVLWDHDLARVAALTAAEIGAPVAIAVPHLQLLAIAPPVDPGLARTLAAHVAALVRGRPAEVPPGVLGSAPIARRGEQLGAVLALDGAHGPARPPAAADVLHVAAVAALTHVATLELRARIEQELHGSLLEQLRGEEPLDPQLLAQRAARLGCDLSGGAVALCFEPQPAPSAAPAAAARSAVALIAAEIPGALVEQVGERVAALLPVDGGAPSLERVKRLVERLRPHGPAGVSRHHAAVGELRQALEEAELVLDVTALHDLPDGVEHAMSGTYRLLLRLLATHPGEVSALYEATVAPLVRYDEHHRTDLVATLETYLELNGNMNATAARIYAHRHTVAYRLDRIRELTRLDPADGEHRERLGLGLKARRLLRRGRR